MRVRFLKDVPINLADVPPSAWGALQSNHQSDVPSINPDVGFISPASWSKSHLFPVTAIAELPDDQAAKFIAAGVAEINAHPCGPIIEVDAIVEWRGRLE